MSSKAQQAFRQVRPFAQTIAAIVGAIAVILRILKALGF